MRAKFESPSYRDTWYDVTISSGENISREEFERRLENRRETYINAMKIAYTRRNYKPEDFRELAAQRFGVTCFSANRDNDLMWAHYADNHQGIVVGIESDYFGPLVYDVQYDSSRVEYSPIIPSETDRSARIISVLRRKSPRWQYEEERRAIVPYQLCIEDGGRWFHPLDPSAVKEVVFGSRTTPALRQQIKDLIKEDLSHVELYKATPTSDSFAISVTRE